MRVLLTGAAGQLGRELRRAVPETVELFAFERARLDLTRDRQVRRRVAETAPRLVINAAAYTAVDAAEDDPASAFAVNADGVARLARAAVAAGARLVQISTDYVFDGRRRRPYRPGDAPGPIGVYGASKLAGEEAALAATAGAALVLRSAWLYSARGRNFVTGVLERMRRGETLRVVRDQTGSPTWAASLARAIWRAASLPALAGVHHWCDAGAVSRHELALAVRDEALAAGVLTESVDVRAVDSAAGDGARRPAYSALDARATQRALGLEAPPWRHSLRRMLAELVA